MEALSQIDPTQLDHIQDELKNKEAFVRIMGDPEHRPLSAYIPELVAATVEPWLIKYKSFNAKTRVAISSFVLFSLNEGNWQKGRVETAQALGVDVRAIDYWRQKWPHMWSVINVLIRYNEAEKVGRVLGAMTDAAIYGDNRDRRLYLEYFGHIKQEQKAQANATIVFVNDNLNRPPASPSVVDVQKVERAED